MGFDSSYIGPPCLHKLTQWIFYVVFVFVFILFSLSVFLSLSLSQRYLTSNLEGQQRIRRPVRSMGEWREISGFFPYPALDMLNDSASCVKKVENDYWELSIYIRDSACLSSINIENHPRIC